MADLDDKNAGLTVKIVGSESTGVEQTPVQSTTAGALHVNFRDNAGTELGTVSNPVITSANIDSGQLVPTITNKFRMRLNVSSISVVSAYTTLFSRTGTGLFFGFQAGFNNSNIRVKLIIDSGIVFENTLSEFQNFQINDTSTTRVQMGAFLTTVGNTLDFSMRYAIPYGTNVSLSVQRSDGSNHTNNNWIVFLTEDT